MSVIEACMVLYAKEIGSGDRVASTIARITGGQLSDPKNYEKSFLHWISHVTAALKKRIDQELEIDGYDQNGQRLQAPDIPPLRDFKDLCDGVCLAYLVSYYCPKIVPWTSVRIKYLPIVEVSYKLYYNIIQFMCKSFSIIIDLLSFFTYRILFIIFY